MLTVLTIVSFLKIRKMKKYKMVENECTLNLFPKF